MNAYDERLKALFSEMNAQGYEPLFKGDAGKALGVIERHLNTMSAYLDRVYEHESVERRMADTEGQELRDEYERVNGRRTSAHNAAMDSLNVLNRVFDAYGMAPFIEVEPGQGRSEIGENIAAYVGAAFLDMDEGATRTNVAIAAHERGVEHEARKAILHEKLAGFSR